MNERIKDLAEQANAWYPKGYPSPEGGNAAWKNLVIFEKEDLQKFAELIVRECARIAEKEQAFNDQYTDAHMHPQVNIDQRILIEFGL